MKKILILPGYYLPGYKDGGPSRSIKNLVDYLGEEYDFRIIAADHDYGEKEPYVDIIRNDWNQVGKAKVWYVGPGGFTGKFILRMAADADVVYVCGCFSNFSRIVLALKKNKKIKAKVTVASMGLFSPGAFRIKYPKKKLYVEMLKMAGYFKAIEWSATGTDEVRDIKRIIGQKAACRIATDLPQQMKYMPKPVEKSEDGLRIIFLSRISRKKNLDYAIKILQNVSERVQFDVYGTMEDEKYYDKCLKEVKKLPAHVIFTYKGEVKPENVIEVFSGYHVFLFPTLGENYGHVIYEAMAGGCIPVISDRTPWEEIGRKGIGKVIPLENKRLFTKTIQGLAEESDITCADRQRRAAEYAWEYSQNMDCQGYRDIFEN